MASGLKSKTSRSESASIPNWWERKLQPSGITYSDPEAFCDNAIAKTPDFHFASSSKGYAPFPGRQVAANEDGSNWGTQQSTVPELNILATEDHQPISHVDMFSVAFGTKHNGFYLSKK